MSVAFETTRLPTGKTLYNHDITHFTADGVVGKHLYSGRALGITGPGDMIQLHPALQPLWQDICGHYRRIGLRHSKDVFWNTELRHLGANRGYLPSVYCYGSNEYQYLGNYEWLSINEFINYKQHFMQVGIGLGMDVPTVLRFDSVDEIDTGSQAIIYPCCLKAAISPTLWIQHCHNRAELQATIQHFATDMPVQIHQDIRAEHFLNLQFQVVDHEPVRLAATEYSLDGFTNPGNHYPAQQQPWGAVEPLARWLCERGMQGVFSCDVAVTQGRHGLRFPVLRCIPRFDSASYPALIAQKLGIAAWSARGFDTRQRSLAEIDLRGIEYEAKTGEGAILVNWGTVLEGRLAIMLCGSHDYQDALAGELEARLLPG